MTSPTKEKVICPFCGGSVPTDSSGRMQYHAMNGLNVPCDQATGHTVIGATAVKRFNETYDANARRRGQYDER